MAGEGIPNRFATADQDAPVRAARCPCGAPAHYDVWRLLKTEGCRDCAEKGLLMGQARNINIIAAACHEVNRAYCEAALGDRSQPPWSEAPVWQRTSASLGVKSALLGATPEESHVGWMKLKLEEGWVFGEVKDAEAKTHPCLVPYGDLPLSQRYKDELFTRTAREMGKALNIEKAV